MIVNGYQNVHVQGIIQDYQLLLQEGGIRHVPVLVLFSNCTLEILGKGNQSQGWEIPMFLTHSELICMYNVKIYMYMQLCTDLLEDPSSLSCLR